MVKATGATCAAVVWHLDTPDIVAHTTATGGDGLLCEHLIPAPRKIWLLSGKDLSMF